MQTSTRPFPENVEPRALRFVLEKRKQKAEPEQMTFDGFPIYSDDPLHETHLLLDAYLREAGKGAHDAKPLKLAAGKALLDLPTDKRAALASIILARVMLYWMECATKTTSVGPRVTLYQIDDDGSRQAIRPLCVAMRRRGEWDLPEEILLDWIEALSLGGSVGSSIDDFLCVDDLFKAVQLHIAKHGMSPVLSAALHEFKKRRENLYSYGREAQERERALDDLLGETPAESKVVLERNEPWAEAALEKLAEKSAAPWKALIEYAAASDGSKPSGKWLKGAKQHVDAIGTEEFRRHVSEWLTLAIQSRTKPLEKDQVAIPWHLEFDIYSEKNENVLKGLAWACGATGDAKLVGPLGGLAEACYKKIPNHGPRSPKVGNACLMSLIALPGQEPRAELTRLKAKVKQPTAVKMIEKAIGASAAAAGMTADDLEELAIGAYGLTEVGRGERKLGDFSAELTIDGTTKVELAFVDAKGNSRASVPAELKSDEHAASLKELQQASKDLAKMLPALRDRLERLPMNQRELPMAAWRERYLDHFVVGTLARRLIWSFSADSKTKIAGMWLNGKLVGADGKPIGKLDEINSSVRLWHPVESSANEVLAWREFLQRHEITQPFKQAYREVYLLTDAERATETYSNRFAAHVLRQHQFAALCVQRGWKYRLMGAWDGGGDTTPTLELPKWGLRAEYWLTGGDVAGDAFTIGSGVAQYVFTDQVRFYKKGEAEPIRIDKIPALVFSEVMRDVDLFVGVTSVGNDPNWVPAGDRIGDYWQRYSFGDLSVSAETRRDVLETLLPRLKIANKAKLSGKFLVVRGDLRTYKIHLGSGNILMEPNDQYLCIVPARGAAAEKLGSGSSVFLPFEGDPTLSVILSKAIMLADDKKIEDPTIMRQIRS